MFKSGVINLVGPRREVEHHWAQHSQKHTESGLGSGEKLGIAGITGETEVGGEQHAWLVLWPRTSGRSQQPLTGA